MGSYVSIPTYMRSLQQTVPPHGAKVLRIAKPSTSPKQPFAEIAGEGAASKASPFARKGKIVSFTVIEPGGAPSEFAEQVRLNGHYGVALIELDGGVRVLAQMTDADPYKMKVGDNVEAVIRVLYEQEGIIRYSFKFRPCVGNESEA